LLALPVLAGIIFIILPALNSANFWEQFFITQSAGNKKNLSFFWILRDYTPEFMCRKLYFVNIVKSFSSFSLKNNKLTNINPNFSSYLAGLIEGDGTIIVPKVERSKKGRLNYPSVQIAFNLRDFPLALVVQQKLRHGSIARKKGVNAYILTINNFEGLILLANIINGYMRTPKITILKELID